MQHSQLDDIIEQLKGEETRWDAILELKLLDDPSWVDPMIPLLKDKDWVVRWCIAEKLGDLGDPKAVSPLVHALADKDFHVRKNAAKALSKFGLAAVPILVPFFAHKNGNVRRKVFAILKSMGIPAIPALSRCLRTASWVVGNKVMHVLWSIGGPMAEEALIRNLKSKDFQKTVIVLLGEMACIRSIPYLVQLVELPPLKRLIYHSIKNMGEKTSFPELIKWLSSEKQAIAKGAYLTIKGMGKPMLNPLVKALAAGKHHNKHICNLLMSIGPKEVMPTIHALAAEKSDVKKATEELRKKYPLG